MTKWCCTICHLEQEEDVTPENCVKCAAHANSMIPLDGVGEDTEYAEFAGLPESLDAVRDRARGKLKDLCAVYPASDGRPDKVCQKEAYGKPIGFGGVGSGASFAANGNGALTCDRFPMIC